LPLKPSLAERANAYQRQTLPGVRAAVRLALAGKDRRAPEMAEVRDLDIAGPGGPIPARLYRPAGAAAVGPALVFFHGGGFVFGEIDGHDGCHRRLAQAAGVTLIGASYRLAPEAAFPAQLDDALAVARWVHDHAAELGVDPARLALGGDSAGGYLAVAATARLNATHQGTIAAQVLIYPLLQLDDEVWASSLFRDSRVVGRLAVKYIRAQLSEVAAAIPSLMHLGSAETPPTVVVGGGVLDPTLMHGFASMTHASPTSRAALVEIGALAGEMLRGLPAG
jgi:acetyl esterase